MIYERELNGVQLRYESDTGEIWRLLNVSCQYGMKGDWVKSGQSVSNGYMKIWIAGKNLRVHRVAWFVVNGKWPNNLLDHIDKDKANNRLSNLREANYSQNAMNCLSGKGWHFNRLHNVWQSSISANGKRYYLGSFKTELEAKSAYQTAAIKYHGEFAARAA